MPGSTLRLLSSYQRLAGHWVRFCTPPQANAARYSPTTTSARSRTWPPGPPHWAPPNSEAPSIKDANEAAAQASQE
eukprot:8298573-Pyramimonas_sp.AAC.1